MEFEGFADIAAEATCHAAIEAVKATGDDWR